MTQGVVLSRKGRGVTIEMLEDRRLLSGTLTLINPEGLPSNDRFVFNRIQIPNPQVNDIVHDTDTIEIKNTGSSALVINSLTLSDTTNWELVNPPAANKSIAAGGTLDVTVKFIAQDAPPDQPTDETNDVVSTDNLPPAQTGGVWDGTLTIASNDPANPTTTAQLAGYWQYESEHEEEPNVQTIVNDLFGYDTAISNTLQPDYPNNGTTPVLYGDEVASGYWQAANPSQAVTVTELAAYHTQLNPDNSGSFLSQNIDWFAQGSPNSTNLLFQHALREGQSLLPNALNQTTGLAQGSFTTSGTFGFDFDGEYSDNALNTTDIQTFGRSGHSVRFYPLIDASGNLVPNTWIGTMDYQNSTFDNSDYQDGVFLITNMHPVTQAPAVTNLQATAAASQVSLQWSGVTDSTLVGYNVYSSTSAGGTFTKLNSSPLTTTSFVDTAPAGSTVYYEVSAVDSAGESEKADASATLSSSGGGSTNGPDISLSAVTGKFKTSAVGGTAAGASKVTITNSGSATAKGKVQISLYLSPTQGVVPAGATAVAHVNATINLKTTKSVNVALPSFKFPSNVTGQEFIVAQATVLSGFSDANTSNNTGSTATPVALTAPFVDLENLFTTLPANLTVGKSTTVVLPVDNLGNITAHGSATVTLTASTTTSASGGTTVLIKKVPVPIAAGKTGKITLSFKVPALTSGTYHLVSDIELPGDAQSGNNVAASSGTFAV